MLPLGAARLAGGDASRQITGFRCASTSPFVDHSAYSRERRKPPFTGSWRQSQKTRRPCSARDPIALTEHQVQPSKVAPLVAAFAVEVGEIVSGVAGDVLLSRILWRVNWATDHWGCTGYR